MRIDKDISIDGNNLILSYNDDETQAKFLNFTNYFIFVNLSNLKIWRLPKNARTFVLANACAIFYIRCCA